MRRGSEATGLRQAPIGESDDNTGKDRPFRAKMPPYPTVPVLFSPTVRLGVRRHVASREGPPQFRESPTVGAKTSVKEGKGVRGYKGLEAME